MTATATPWQRDWRFWAITLAAVAGCAIAVSLGFWQLSRAAQKEALQAAINAQKQLPPMGADALVQAPDPAPLFYRQATLRGTWVPAHTVFLDNRQLNGKPGFFVMTPLQLAAGGRAVIVQRGWVQRNFTNRAQLPQVPTPVGEVEVTGRIAPPPSKLYDFKGAEAGPIRQNLDLAMFRQETGLPLLEMSLLQTSAPSDGLQRDWPDANLGVGKHYGYTFQWWGLAALIATLYVWFQIVRRIRNARSA
ncbi:MAG: SURF1 family protein [Comamonadaceae bacterium]|nr:MAG: SURF1 family protein [Comamonadaceae bacterium]